MTVEVRPADVRLLELMLKVRRFEEAVWDVYRRGMMPGLAHLSIGQEAVAIGVTIVVIREGQNDPRGEQG